ncbi:MAG: amidohydrolase family protein [Thermoanaerobaculia bacterium]
MTAKLLAALAKHRVPAVGFVNEGKLVVVGEGPAAVARAIPSRNEVGVSSRDPSAGALMMPATTRLALLCTLILAARPLVAADLLVDNVNGYTLDTAGKLQHFEALLVADGKVVATGNHADLATRAGAAKIVDGKGRTLLPGLIDAHGHVMGLGAMALQADLTGTASLDAALVRIQSFAASHKEDRWIVGRGWNQVLWKLGRFPVAKELDAVVADRPAWMERIDGHAAWANSAAIELAGITRETKDPVGGRIERDAEGNPSGVFVDAAMELVGSKIPPPTDAQRSAALTSALATMASVGMTGVGDAGIDLTTFKLYQRFANEGKLTARIYAMIGGTGKDFDAISKDGPLIGYGHDFLSVRSVKLYADGALGSRGAAMLMPYSDDTKNSGLLFSQPDEMTAMISKALGHGYQVCVHAIGDKGNREVLDSFSAAYKEHPDGKALRNRIEHAQVVSRDDIPRFLALDLIASMQPTHATSDMNMAEDRVGPERIQGAYAWRTFLKQGTRIAGGSDFPVESPNPFYGLHAAVTRQDHEGHPPGGWHPEQALSATEALRAFTLDAAYAAHQEGTLGTLEPGKWADFILVDQDLFTIDPANIWKTRVLQTWVAGKSIYQASTGD